MGKLTSQFPRFPDQYDGALMREFVRKLEDLFSRVEVSSRHPAYTITAAATLDAMDDVVLCNTTSAGFTVTFPQVSDAMIDDRREFTLIKTTDANVLTLAGTGGNTISGTTTVDVVSAWTALHVRAVTGGWVIL